MIFSAYYNKFEILLVFRFCVLLVLADVLLLNPTTTTYTINSDISHNFAAIMVLTDIDINMQLNDTGAV